MNSSDEARDAWLKEFMPKYLESAKRCCDDCYNKASNCETWMQLTIKDTWSAAEKHFAEWVGEFDSDLADFEADRICIAGGEILTFGLMFIKGACWHFEKCKAQLGLAKRRKMADDLAYKAMCNAANELEKELDELKTHVLTNLVDRSHLTGAQARIAELEASLTSTNSVLETNMLREQNHINDEGVP